MTATDVVTFWVFECGRWQGVRLGPGESVAFSEGGDTDEGWSRSDADYRLDADGYVYVDCYSDGVDCDGRMSTEWHARCSVSDLTSQPADGSRPARPTWTELRRGQRDYAAEAMGY